MSRCFVFKNSTGRCFIFRLSGLVYLSKLLAILCVLGSNNFGIVIARQSTNRYGLANQCTVDGLKYKLLKLISKQGQTVTKGRADGRCVSCGTFAFSLEN